MSPRDSPINVVRIEIATSGKFSEIVNLVDRDKHVKNCANVFDKSGYITTVKGRDPSSRVATSLGSGLHIFE